jgi:hypothetical protein
MDNEVMAYHFINLVFLVISIEGVARDRAIEILEKRGLLSQVGGGAIAGAITPTPLFGLNFPSTEPLQMECSLLLKQTFRGFVKGRRHGPDN